ncbi:MAG: non-canonical purine NTP diphosphatase [Bacteroidales bacterium]|nr:non-canonical purine NTP diphosphatase [Bacteroidales bacterium]
MQLIFATNNKHKLEEISALLKGYAHVKGLKEIGIHEEIPENCDTLEGNAVEKAMYIFSKYGYNCFADDTGLEIEALNGRPGVYSARYAGTGCSFDDNVNKILAELGNEKNRRAKFRTVIAMVENGQVKTFEGEVHGIIIEEKKGSDGFGYDPVFVPDGYEITFAEMSLDIKNKISHRAMAMQKFVRYLQNHTK